MIYLDNNATTPIDRRVVEAMCTVEPGNPSSLHAYGRAAKQILIQAKQQFLDFFEMDDILFTSGATEALNCLVASLPSGAHLVTSSLEHVAVCEAVNARSDIEITRITLPTAEAVKEAITPQTAMILLTAANNETGICTDLEAIGEIAQFHGIDFVVDGVALLGKEIFTLPKGVTAACFSGHKIHGPMGVGCIVYRKSFRIKPLILGGAQQRGLRGGTENLPAIVGFAKALELIDSKQIERMRALRDRFEQELLKTFPDLLIHGKDLKRVSNTSNIAFSAIDGETLLMQLDLNGVAISHGAACSSGALEPSHVILNMGFTRAIARHSIRFSLSRLNTDKEIDRVLKLLTAILKTEG
ncbi:MAG: Cysteine desulfurase NifS [Chlamydiales bacterium]|nr:Cysteine desulfurase NifS [Chlamydiales bacterium]MCH9620504.1 Cysteine desulfurase NifS [Chlamydiales bacterium]MCH9623489.1 Cysteine desulfurase NifS [Chlamydiales bacterium]